MTLAQEVINRFGEKNIDEKTAEDVWLSNRDVFLTNTEKVIRKNELIPALRKKAKALAKFLRAQGAVGR